MFMVVVYLFIEKLLNFKIGTDSSIHLLSKFFLFKLEFHHFFHLHYLCVYCIYICFSASTTATVVAVFFHLIDCLNYIVIYYFPLFSISCFNLHFFFKFRNILLFFFYLRNIFK